MSVNSTPDMSICLYDFLCQNIVGSEDYIKLSRLMNASKDRIYSDKLVTYITSGSVGEGLDLQGSDLDIMYVVPTTDIAVKTNLHVNDYHSDKICLLLDTDDVKPGFAYLRLIKGILNENMLMRRNIKRHVCISSEEFKKSFRTEHIHVHHGPCISDTTGYLDIAYCLHSKLWIPTALEWITRPNDSWPSSEIKQTVIDHGVLFVPIGNGENLNEELKWRISFSVGEKFLIYSFTHTQLLCYSLLKILLKDVISEFPGCNDLLCSYFIKSILFWLSEELPTSVWRPENLIPCFMRCFKRLVYCVEHSMCPHYFIPENNLFGNKIVGPNRTKLLQTLCILKKYGWQCILFSSQLSRVSYIRTIQFKDRTFFEDDIEKIMKSKVLSRWLHNRSGGFIRHLQLLLSYQSKKLRSISLHNITQISNYAANTVPLSSVYGNKYQYKQYKQCVSFLLQSTHHDAVSGWLMLASLFYKMKTYSKALNVLSYSLGKCTSEKIVPFATLSSSQRELFRLPMLKKLGIIRSLRILYLSDIKFNESNLIPDELYIGGNNLPKMIPAVVYAYFLKFLCQYHLHNISNYRKSLTDLQLIIEREYLIFGDHLTAFSYHCLGVALLIVGEYEAARKVFIRSIEICPSPLLNSSHKRLSMMESI